MAASAALPVIGDVVAPLMLPYHPPDGTPFTPRAPGRPPRASPGKPQVTGKLGKTSKVEVFFSIITRQAIRRGSFTSVQDLITAIENFTDGWNDRCRPFTWTNEPTRYSRTAVQVKEPRSHDTDLRYSLSRDTRLRGQRHVLAGCPRTSQTHPDLSPSRRYGGAVGRTGRDVPAPTDPVTCTSTMTPHIRATSASLRTGSWRPSHLALTRS
jgi:hypothetical protein